MLFIAIGTDLHPDRFAPLMAEEAAVLAQLRAEGTVRAVYKRTAGGGVFSVIEAASPQEAAEQLARLPLIREGLLVFELTEVNQL